MGEDCCQKVTNNEEVGTILMKSNSKSSLLIHITYYNISVILLVLFPFKADQERNHFRCNPGVHISE